MRKTLLLIAGILFCEMAKAQVPNPGFETLNSLGAAANWRQTDIVVIPIDTGCLWIGADSMAFTTAEAHTGSYAYELRTSTYCEASFGGRVTSTRFDFDTFTNQAIPFTERPYAFTFYYKLFPVLGDQGEVQIYLETEDGSMVANADMRFGDSAATWTLATVPLTYSTTETPAYLKLKFIIRADSVFHLGTRFLFDDINHIGTTDISGPTVSEQYLQCYPVPTENRLFVLMHAKAYFGDVTVNIADAAGRIVRREKTIVNGTGRLELNTADIPKGIYFLDINTGDVRMKGKFVK